MKSMNEEYLANKAQQGADFYYRKFRPQMEALEHKSAISKVRPVTSYDFYALGKMLEAYQSFEEDVAANGSVGDLGIIPRIAYDVVTLAYGTSPISIVAGIQNIEEENGIVYYKDVVAGQTLGNMTANEKIFSATQAPKFPVGYAGQSVSESLGNVSIGSGTGPYTGTLTYRPIRPYSVTVTIADTTVITLTDDGNGNLVGAGAYGTITYGTSGGAYSITLLSAPSGTKAMTATYQCQVEAQASAPPIIQYELQSKPIFAKVYALRSTFGMLKSYALKKRFGTVAEDEAALDLTNAINMEVFGDMVTKLYNNTTGNTDWSYTAPTGVSYYEHQHTLKHSLARAEEVIVTNAGRGTRSFMVAGSAVCSIIEPLPGFQKLYDGNSIAGAHLFGTLDGVPIVRVPIAALLPANKCIIGYKGVSAFEVPAVYAPYMPLTTTAVLPTANPLTMQRGAAVWAGVEVLVPNFLTMLTVTNYA